MERLYIIYNVYTCYYRYGSIHSKPSSTQIQEKCKKLVPTFDPGIPGSPLRPGSPVAPLAPTSPGPPRSPGAPYKNKENIIVFS